MKIDLSDRTAVVTGSTLGIGYAIARGLFDAGANVVINGRDQERIDQAVASFDLDQGRVQGVLADIGTAEGCARLTAAAPHADILVNNAAAFGPQPFLEIPDEKWERLFETNVMASVRLARHYVPLMQEANWGRLIFISSVDAVQVPALNVDYAATKLALIAVSRGIAESVRGQKITSNSLLVGPTHSDGFEVYLGFSSREGYSAQSVLPPPPPMAATVDEAISGLLTSDVYSSSLIERMGQCEEVANMAVYLASDQASVTTGAALRVDGGVLRGVV
jgi:NAD(P)-dependent dehydrogenase (short-subunit alcohol dehydrogenase family)